LEISSSASPVVEWRRQRRRWRWLRVC
jgi:hypothetical protein